MARKANNTPAIVGGIVIIAIVIAVIAAFGMGIIPIPEGMQSIFVVSGNGSGGQSPLNIWVTNLFNQTTPSDSDDDDTPTPPAPPQEGCSIDISQAYHTQLDPWAPGYLAAKSMDCASAGGHWVDSHDQAGCFEIPVWDVTNCNTNEVIVLQNICLSLQEPSWVCTVHEVGCYC